MIGRSKLEIINRQTICPFLHTGQSSIAILRSSAQLATGPYRCVALEGERRKLCLPRDRIWHSLFGCLDRFLIREHFVDVASILRILHHWLIGCRNKPISQVSPVDVAEKWVAHYVSSIRARC